ncbi:MAG TPA: NAD(+) diphosphatase [Hyphomicrobiales bacterium]|nr:NAD(+) diphosphatase [Hyphomicrobiales bacterium]
MHKLIKPPKIAAQTGLRRRSEKRTDSAFIAAAQTDPAAKILALFDLRIPIVPSEDQSSAVIRWFSRREIEDIAEPKELVFLGEEENARPVFACNFEPFQTVHAGAALEGLKPLVDLRSLALQGVLSEVELLVASQARALLGWHALNRCCIRCGSIVKIADAGWRRHCGACGLDNYPRTDPAVIMLITSGDRCLLGHEHRFPDKFYSTLAGFVEAGDDIEHAVRREVKEEAGIDVGEVRYVASQPWPFPHSLMIGCWGHALTDKIMLDAAEIADARWFTREEAASMLARNHPEGLFVPPPISMAHTLIRAFVDRVLGA